MKTLYVALAIALSIFVLMLCVFHLTYAHPPKEKSIADTPMEADIDPEEDLPKVDEEIPSVDTLKSLISKKNLFSPDRGKPPQKPPEPKSLGPKINKEKLELIGVFIFGESSGAIILDLNKGAPPPLPGRPAVPPPPGPPGAPAAPDAAGDAKNHQTAKVVPRDNKAKRYFKLNEEMENGYIVKKIAPDSVLLVRGGDTIELKLEKSDKDSRARMESNKTAATPPTILGMEPPKQPQQPQLPPGAQLPPGHAQPQPPQPPGQNQPAQPPQLQPPGTAQPTPAANLRGAAARAGVRKALEESKAQQGGQTTPQDQQPPPQ